jgi:histidyl-tRNA synthetase
MLMIQSLRGMKDLMHEDAKKFQFFIESATKVAKNYGFEYIETPLLEETKLFKRSVGESSDIVNKEMYQFIDKGENDVCLRPEGTAGVVRSFIQNKLDKAGMNQRFFYHGPMFRYERPQKGRLREFHQFGVESFGEQSVYEDIKVIAMCANIFDGLAIKYKLKINSLGCDECMPTYKEELVKFLDPKKEHLCEDCKVRIVQNPIRTLDCKVESCKVHLLDAPKMNKHLCDNCNSDFEKLKDMLAHLEIEYEIDDNLVRGLDYYTQTAFEFVSDEIGAQSAIAGGGRYDKLVEMLDGKPTPAVGFAIGIERLLDLVHFIEHREGVYVGVLLEEATKKAIKKAYNLRKYEKVFFEPTVKSMKAHLKSADRMNMEKVIIIGEEELANNTIWEKILTD